MNLKGELDKLKDLPGYDPKEPYKLIPFDSWKKSTISN